MKKAFIKSLSVMLAVVLTLTAAPLSGFVGLELPEWLDFSIMSSAAETSGKCGANVTWTFDEPTGTLTISGTGVMYDYNYNNRPWESYEDSIKTVVINDNVTTIGSCAFHSCDSLTSVTIGNSVTTIGDYAFYDCDKLTSVTIGNSVQTISDRAFYYCTSLESIMIPDSVTTIEYEAFFGCTYLANLTIGTSVTIIGYCAFSYCTSLTSITIPESVSNFGNGAFSNCTNLESVTISDGVTSIGIGTFIDCTNLKTVKIPESVLYIGYQTFMDCTNLTDVYYGSCKGKWNDIIIEDFNFTGITTIHFSDHTNHWVTITEASCEKNGALLGVCSLCGESTFDIIDATGHNYTSAVTAPTCTKQGYTTYTCACGDSYTDDAVDALGHSTAVSENILVAPTCTENGSKEVVVTCTICSKEMNRETTVVDAKGHDLINGDCANCDYTENTGNEDNNDDNNEDVNDPSENCSCNCHKSGISNFFFKIGLFFQQLFGSNKMCSCGVAHY